MKPVVRVAVLGQPNSGKSELLNALTGATLKVGNFAGVTVDKKEVVVERAEARLILTDLPGLHGLNCYSPDEEVAKGFLLASDYDVLLNVLDGNALSRSLDLTLQMLDWPARMLVAINMIDEVEKQGGMIDAQCLEQSIGIPVQLVSARRRVGLETLLTRIVAVFQEDPIRHHVAYDRHVETAIAELEQRLVRDVQLAERARFHALRLLEEDRDIYRMIHDKPVFISVLESLERVRRQLALLSGEEDTCMVMAQARAGMIRFMLVRAMRQSRRQTWTQRIDEILIHPWLGMPIFFIILWSLFQLTFTVGAMPVEWLEAGQKWLSDFLGQQWPPGAAREILLQGILPAVGTVFGFLPNILILFMGINLLEQTGYMARAAYLLDGVFKRFGLHGKSFIPLVTGFGCSIPAYLATRTLKNPKDKLITMLVIGFFSCSAKLPVYVLFITAFFPPEQAGNVLFLLYLLGALLGLISARLLRQAIFHGEPEPFVMEMPRYRLPSFRALLRELEIRTVLFFKRAGLYIGVASLVIWALSSHPMPPVNTTDPEMGPPTLEESYIGRIGAALQPLFAPLGFDWKMSVTVLAALAAKEVAVGTLAALHAVEESAENRENLLEVVRDRIDFASAMGFLVMMMIYSPCMAAIGTFFSEIREVKWRLLYLIYPNLLAWVAAYATVGLLNGLGW